MKKILFLTLLSLSFAQETDETTELISFFGGNISFGGAFPQGEFRNQEIPAAIVLDMNLLYYLNDYAAIGLNLGGSQYGFSEREIPFNQWVALNMVFLNEKFHLINGWLLDLLKKQETQWAMVTCC